MCVWIVSNQHKNAKYKFYSAKTPDAFSLFTLEGLSLDCRWEFVLQNPGTNIRICLKWILKHGHLELVTYWSEMPFQWKTLVNCISLFSIRLHSIQLCLWVLVVCIKYRFGSLMWYGNYTVMIILWLRYIEFYFLKNVSPKKYSLTVQKE